MLRWFLIGGVLLALILVPFFVFEDQFNRLGAEITAGRMASWPAAVLVGSLLALDVVLPVPSSLVSTAAGALLGFTRGMAIVWAGMTVSCVLGHLLGSRATGAARRFVGPESLARAERIAAEYGDWAIVVCRPVPVLAEASVILAGLVRAPWRRFLLLTSSSNLGIAAAYAGIGAFSMSAGSFLLTFAGAIALPAIAMLAARLWLRR